MKNLLQNLFFLEKVIKLTLQEIKFEQTKVQNMLTTEISKWNKSKQKSFDRI